MNKSLSTISIIAFLLLSNSKSLGMDLLLARLNQRQLLLKNEPENKPIDHFVKLPTDISQNVFGFLVVPSFYALSQTSQSMHKAVFDYEPRYATTLLTQKAIALNIMQNDREEYRIYKKNNVEAKESYMAFDDRFRMGRANLALAACCKHPKDAISFARKIISTPYTLPWSSSKESL